MIAHAGPWLAILGGIITGHCIVQRLTDFLWIPVHSTHDDNQFLRIARVFYALRESIQRLDSWYKDTITGVIPLNESSPHVPHPRFFPSPNVYRDGDNLVRFAYQVPLELDVSCVTYRAKTLEDNPKDIVVKFVTSYGADAHRVMASVGLAPELLYHGPIDVELGMPSYGDLCMVVMEYVDGLTLNKAWEQHKVPQSFQSDLRTAFQHLHDAGYVFGDLRQPNVMITREGKVQLIDFDWAGKDGEVKYPVAISGSIDWPAGAQGLARIRKEHDSMMLNKLLNLIS
jgi:serine/threonine protein kinase